VFNNNSSVMTSTINVSINVVLRNNPEELTAFYTKQSLEDSNEDNHEYGTIGQHYWRIVQKHAHVLYLNSDRTEKKRKGNRRIRNWDRVLYYHFVGQIQGISLHVFSSH